jgi:hypothetical protein
MKSLLTLSLLVVVAIPVRADEKPKTVQDLVAEFKLNPQEAAKKYVGETFKFEIEVQNRIKDGSKNYHQVVAGEIPKGAHVVMYIPKKLYRPTDKLEVTATLKSSSWDKDDKWLRFDPVAVDKELSVLPAITTSGGFLQTYLRDQKGMSKKWVGKEIDMSGAVKFLANGGVVLEYVPRMDAKGRIEHDFEGWELLGRPLVTIRFADGQKSIRDASLRKGVEIEIRGTIAEMQAGAIIIKDAKLLK